jgi:outer membrane protein assembly factor BamE (lipoprotein component of BamABCDE complex)
MKSYKLLFLLPLCLPLWLILASPAVAEYCKFKPELQQSLAARVKKNMTKSQVISAIGKPNNGCQWKNGNRWVYALSSRDGKVLLVDFDSNGKVISAQIVKFDG